MKNEVLFDKSDDNQNYTSHLEDESYYTSKSSLNNSLIHSEFAREDELSCSKENPYKINNTLVIRFSMKYIYLIYMICISFYSALYEFLRVLKKFSMSRKINFILILRNYVTYSVWKRNQFAYVLLLKFISVSNFIVCYVTFPEIQSNP